MYHLKIVQNMLWLPFPYRIYMHLYFIELLPFKKCSQIFFSFFLVGEFVCVYNYLINIMYQSVGNSCRFLIDEAHTLTHMHIYGCKSLKYICINKFSVLVSPMIMIILSGKIIILPFSLMLLHCSLSKIPVLVVMAYLSKNSNKKTW